MIDSSKKRRPSIWEGNTFRNKHIRSQALTRSPLTWCVVLLGLLAGECLLAGSGAGSCAGGWDGGRALPSAAAPPCPNNLRTCSGDIGRFLPFAALRWFVLFLKLVAPAVKNNHDEGFWRSRCKQLVMTLLICMQYYLVITQQAWCLGFHLMQSGII